MLTETVLVLRGNSQPEFVRRTIYKPIMNAINLYEDWAKEEGIKINQPEAMGYPKYFPELEIDYQRWNWYLRIWYIMRLNIPINR